VLPASTPPVVKLLGVAPNPASLGAAAIQLRFELAHATRAQVEVFDTTGRMVRRLIDENLSSGPHSTTWDGRNDAGRLAAPGVYFYHLATEGGFSGSQKVVVLR
jgi:flagellar hook assembly protein FlgD